MPSIDNSKCILITGATSGLGRALALALVKLPSHPTVIAAGRRKERLEELSEIEGIHTVQLDLGVAFDEFQKSVQDLLRRFPDLDTVILNAGIQYEFDFRNPQDINFQEVLTEIHTNYTANIAFITYILPHFLKLSDQGRPSFIVIISSSLAVVPNRPLVANYSATKAAIHSFALSLRAQLIGTHVNIIDILPPLVESELHNVQGKTEQLSKKWLPLEEFIKEAVDGLRKGAHNIPVGTVKEDFEKFEKGKEEAVMQAAQ